MTLIAIPLTQRIDASNKESHEDICLNGELFMICWVKERSPYLPLPSFLKQ